ncbi:L-dopachrome tautomerase-related protein [Rhizosaccharibacter radicis]|uniref:Major royal jelly family protein n=1 Tax=Rhizosaccharibacter radicis TaxID=2782605 RepID=A0ABT1VTW9_9PROT|nr:major royal jelly family protein [Acetobacteraceae bacterium KSS12]
MIAAKTLFSRSILVGSLLLATAAAPRAAPDSGPAGPQGVLLPVFSSSLVINGVATTPDGRMFMPVQPGRPGRGPEVVEVRDGRPVPFPDKRWNGWRKGRDGADRFVGVNALRVGPDGALWVVDRGAPGIGKPIAPHGVKLVRIDLAGNKVSRSYDLSAVTGPKSFVDDVRFNGDRAYLTDAGQPGLILLDLRTGAGRRVLDGDPSVTARTPLMAEGQRVIDPEGRPVVIHADQLELSPDARWFYYQPCNGGMSRIETRFLDDASLPASELARHVEHFADTPSTGGTAMDADGTIYLSDVNSKRILAIAPDGRMHTILSDPRLVWVDAMWLDDKGRLLMPAAQLNRTAGLNGGRDAVRQPITLYGMALGVQPSHH